MLNRTDVPLDTTPFTFDSQFYLEVILRGNGSLPPAPGQAGAQVPNALAAQGELRLQSDSAIANNFITECIWQSMIDNQTQIQTGFIAVSDTLFGFGKFLNNSVMFFFCG